MRRLEVGPLKSGGAESLSPRSSSLAILFLKNDSRETDQVKSIYDKAGKGGSCQQFMTPLRGQPSGCTAEEQRRHGNRQCLAWAFGRSSVNDSKVRRVGVGGF